MSLLASEKTRWSVSELLNTDFPIQLSRKPPIVPTIQIWEDLWRNWRFIGRRCDGYRDFSGGLYTIAKSIGSVGIPLYVGKSINISRRLEQHKAKGEIGDYYFSLSVDSDSLRSYLEPMFIRNFYAVLNIQHSYRGDFKFSPLNWGATIDYIDSVSVDYFNRHSAAIKTHGELLVCSEV